MEVLLSPDQQEFVKLAIENGRLRSEQDALAEALALWEDRERERITFLATLSDAQAALARGEGLELNEQSLEELSRAIKERGRARLAAELARTA